MSCLILGDSIAVGLSGVIKGCMVIAKVGMSSAWILAHAYGGNFDTVYLSSGSNDPYNPALEHNLMATREKYPNSRFAFIEPVNGRASAIVREVARQHNDIVIGFIPGPDHVHPRSYQEVGRSLR